MPLNPDELDPDRLPHASVGGFKPGPVVELLRRVSWDYRQVLHDNRRLHEQLAALQERAEGLERQLETVQEPRKPPDELARQMLAASQRAARDVREATREECELTLRKARHRANRIDREHARAVAELRALEDLRRSLEERLRSSLSAALDQRGEGQTQKV